MRFRIACILLLASIMSCKAQIEIPSGSIIRLYDGKAPGSETWNYPEGLVQGPDGQRTLFNITEPTLEYFPAENPSGAAMLVVPGGGFQILSYDGEGTMVAKELNSRGISAFVLKYRTRPMLDEDGKPVEGFGSVLASLAKETQRTTSVFESERPEKTPGAYDLASRVEYMTNAYADADAAVSYIRSHAKELGIKKIGVMGFSAGAIVSLHLAQYHGQETRPDFVGVIYGGWNDSFAVPEDGMPMFLCSPVNDVFLPEENLRVFSAWHAKGLPVENHLYYDCQHGFGANETGKAVDGWIEAMYRFMKDVKFVQ